LQGIARPHLEKAVTDFLSKYEWKWLHHAPYIPDMSPLDLDLFRKWTPFFLPGRGFCSGYPSHPRTEQKWHPKWNSKSSETLGRGHWEAGGLHRKTVKRYCLKWNIHTSKK
jgi:hypothetical protein